MGENLASLSADAKANLFNLVIIDHEAGTEVYGTDNSGEAITARFKSFGSLPWEAVFREILREGGLGFVEPGVKDEEPDTGFDRYTFRARVY